MQEEEDEDDIYAPDDSIPGLSKPAPTSGGGGAAIPPKANDELEEGEEEDEEMEEDYGESDSVRFSVLLSLPLLLLRLFYTKNTITTTQLLLSSEVYIAVEYEVDGDVNISCAFF